MAHKYAFDHSIELPKPMRDTSIDFLTAIIGPFALIAINAKSARTAWKTLVHSIRNFTSEFPSNASTQCQINYENHRFAMQIQKQREELVRVRRADVDAIH